MTDIGKDELDELQSVSVKIVTEHLRDQKHNGSKTDFALRSLSAVARIKGTQRAGEATQAGIIRDISANQEEYKKYLAISLPHLNPVCKIEQGKKG